MAGRYRIEENKVMVTVNLFQGKKKTGQFSVAGEKAKVSELIAKIIAEMEKHLGSSMP